MPLKTFRRKLRLSKLDSFLFLFLENFEPNIACALRIEKKTEKAYTSKANWHASLGASGLA